MSKETPMSKQPVEVLTVRQMAVRLGCSIAYVYSMVRAERVSGAYMEDGEWRVPLGSIKEYEATRKRRVKPVRAAHGVVEAAA